MNTDEFRLYIRKHELKQAMFLTFYWLWCFTFLMIAIFRIADGAGFEAVGNGVIQFSCLMLSTVWIDDLLNCD